MTRINVLTFGAITEITGEERFEFDNIDTIELLQERLEGKFPSLKDVNYAIAVDKRIVSGNVALSHGATVALLPPFSGG